MRRWIVATAAGLVLVVAAVGTLSHQIPVRTRPPAPAERGATRLVSLAPSVTEILFALGLQDRLVGVSTACDFPPEAKALRKAGDFGAPDIEVLSALRPDVVFVTSLRDPEAEQAVARTGARLVRVRQARLADVPDAVRRIGRVAGVPVAAERYAAALERRIAAATTRVPESERPRVYVELSGKPLRTAGKGSFLDDLIRRAGGRNIAGDIDRPWTTISPDDVIARDPQIILVMHPISGDAAAAVAGRVGWANIRAVRSGHVFANINPDLLLRPGPRLVDGLERLAGLFARYRRSATPGKPATRVYLPAGAALVGMLFLCGVILFVAVGGARVRDPARRKLAAGFLVLATALAAVFFWSLIAGRARVPVGSLFARQYLPIVEGRAARTILGIVVGAGLSVAGLILQAVLRNPLADPYVLGVSSGAGLGAAWVIVAGLTTAGSWVVPGAAFTGAVAAILLVYVLARVGKSVPVYTLLLSGVIVNAIASSLLIFLAHTAIARGRGLHSVMWWLLGSLQVLENWEVVAAGGAVAAGIALTLLFTRDLNVLSIGEEPAAHLGLRVERTKKLLFVVSSLVTGAAVAACGLIGFVGLIVPHAVRMAVGPDNRVLVPLSALAGGTFLVVCDIIARTIAPGGELPIGVITAFLGGPFFIYLLRAHRRNRSG